MQATLLVELLTEELPPKSLRLLGEVFKDRLLNGLIQYQLKPRVPAGTRFFATPRRLAVCVPDVKAEARDRETEVMGPPANAPAHAVAGFAKKHGVAVERLERRATPKGEILLARVTIKGALLDQVLAHIVGEALKALPIPKIMRWGSGEAEFIRPVHGLVMMHGSRVVAGEVLGLRSGNRTRGHRFMGKGEIALESADEYEAKLRDEGMVIADFVARRTEIARLLAAEAGRERATIAEDEALLDEVTALVEHPSVQVGRFEEKYLEVPHECLILTMRQNQKYFPLFDAQGRLLPKFLIVSNMRVADHRHIVLGNERVVRPRLEDARFFYDQDRKIRLEERVPRLAKVIHHNKLGSQLERVERIQLLAGRIADALGADRLLAERAAWLAKADLLTGMVGEFPELQGIMGAYYAAHDGEPGAVVAAIRDQYRLRFDHADPGNLVSASLYLADRVDALIGMFAIGNAPSGEKDPFGLRRAALGIISVYELIAAAARISARACPDVRDLLEASAGGFPKGLVESGTAETVHEFILERYRHHLATIYAKDAIDAVLSQRPHLGEVVARVSAVEAFRKLPQAESLAAAIKRIRNILLKSPPPSEQSFSERLFVEGAERELFSAFQRVDSTAQADLARGRFADALSALAVLKEPVDAFFDRVMVNVEDSTLRNNRLMLLKQLDAALNRVADISRLAA